MKCIKSKNNEYNRKFNNTNAKIIVLFIRFLLQYRINRVFMHHAYIIHTYKIIKT